MVRFRFAPVSTPPAPAPEIPSEVTAATPRPRQLRLLQVSNPITTRVGPEVFAKLPQNPGVYFFHDATGKLLYIGQSLNLRARVTSYRHVSPERHPRRILRLVHRIARIEWQTCDTAEAAIELERVLLLKHRPPFNRAGTWQAPPWNLQVAATQDFLHLTLTRTEIPPPISAANELAVGIPSRTRTRAATPNLPLPDDTFTSELAHPSAGEPALPPTPLFAVPRMIHATLCRCLMRLYHPDLSLGQYPAGLLNFNAPLKLKLPFPGEAPTVANLLEDFLSGRPDALLAALDPLLVEEPSTDLSADTAGQIPEPDPYSIAAYWSGQAEMLQTFALKKLLPLAEMPTPPA